MGSGRPDIVVSGWELMTAVVSESAAVRVIPWRAAIDPLLSAAEVVSRHPPPLLPQIRNGIE